MTSRVTEDAALQQQTMPTALLGVDMITTFVANATPELDCLLRKECDIILECRFCRNFFRSIINFVSHKRTSCRGLYQTVAAAANAIGDIGLRSNDKGISPGGAIPRASSGDPPESSNSASTFDNNDREPTNETDEACSSHTSIYTGTHLSRKSARKARSGPSTALRRVNPVAVLNKRIETTTVELADGVAKIDLHTLPRIAKSVPTTKISNGVQVVVDMPNDLAVKEPIESDRVVMVIPQDLTSSYGNMRLRNRRQAPGAENPARSVSPAEMELVERMTTQMGVSVEVTTLSCLADSCEKEKRTFSSLKCLSYHYSVRHKPRIPNNNRYLCLLCGSAFIKNVGLQTHMRMFHRDIYDEHQRSRSLEREDASKRRVSRHKKKSDERPVTATEQPRSRSMSPLSHDEDDDHEQRATPISAISPHISRSASRNVTRSLPREPRSLSVSANRRVQIKTNGDRLETVLAGLRRGQVDTVELTILEKLALSADSTPGQSRRSRKRGATRKIEQETNSATATPTLPQTPPKRGAGRPRKVVIPVVTEDSVLSPLDDGVVNGKTAENGKMPSLTKATSTPVARKATSNVDKADDCAPLLQPVQANNDDAPSPPLSQSPPPIVKKERSVSSDRPVSNKAAVEDEHVKTATTTDANGDAELNRRTSRERAKRSTVPVLESEKSSSSSSDDDDKHTNTSAESGANDKSPAQDESTAVPVKRAKSVTRQRKSVEADLRTESDESMEKLPVPVKTVSKRKAPSPDSSDEEEEEEELSAVRATRSKRTPAYLSDGSFITGPHFGNKNRDNREDPDKTKESTPRSAKTITPTKRSESSATGKRKSPKVNTGSKAKHARVEPPTSGNKSVTSASKAKAAAALVSPPGSPSESRRKQNLSALPPTRSDDVQIIKMPNQNPQRPRDLSDLPVYLTEGQRDLFTRSLQVLGAAKEDRHKCVHCDSVLPNIQEGRRHVVMHLNVIRLKCSLCGVGSFFCSDMRSHLMNRHCVNMERAPAAIVRSGKDVPCMTQEQADSLTNLVDVSRPGRVLYTSGKVMSNEHPAGVQPPPLMDAKLLSMNHVSLMYGGGR